MKNFFIQLFSVALIIVLTCSLLSCNASETEDEQQSQSSHSYVKDLRTQVKKNPSEYNGKQVEVKGWLYIDDDVFYLVDSKPTGVQFRYELNQGNIANIELTIYDQTIINVLESGDYIEVFGKVQISEKGISLNQCRVTVITPREES